MGTRPGVRGRDLWPLTPAKAAWHRAGGGRLSEAARTPAAGILAGQQQTDPLL